MAEHWTRVTGALMRKRILPVACSDEGRHDFNDAVQVHRDGDGQDDVPGQRAF